MFYNDGDHYNGNWSNGKKQGKGKFTWANGDWYEGNFDNGDINGKGYKFFAKKGNKGNFYYDGKFTDWKFIEGDCYMDRGDGITYKGGYKDDKFHGYGEL
jgi:hypothetical protein